MAAGRRKLWKYLCLLAALVAAATMVQLAAVSSFKDDADAEEVADEDGDRHEFFFLRGEAEQSSRRALVKAGCERHNLTGLGAVSRIPGPLVEVDRHRIFFCQNAKTGTTTWNSHFFQLSGFTEAELRDRIKRGSFNRVVHSLFRADTKHGRSPHQSLVDYIRQRKLLSFTFVRHPFERLVSAFEGKVLTRKDKAYHRLRRQVKGSFSKFVDHILWHKEWRRCVPTKCKIDRHWKPYTANCAPCKVEYDIIGKLETFDDDTRHIFHLTNLTSMISMKEAGKRLNPSRKRLSQHDGRSEGEQKGLKYFSELSKHQKEELYDLYRLDFELFGYSPEPYMYL